MSVNIVSTPALGPNEYFEALGRLYERRFHRLRPGKDEPMGSYRNSDDDENTQQFLTWIKGQALDDALARMVQLEDQLEAIEREMP